MDGKTLPISPYGFFGGDAGTPCMHPKLEESFQEPSGSSGVAALPAPSLMEMLGEEFLPKQTQRWQGGPVSGLSVLAFGTRPELVSQENNT